MKINRVKKKTCFHCLFSQSFRFNINIAFNRKIYCDLRNFYFEQNINNNEKMNVMRLE